MQYVSKGMNVICVYCIILWNWTSGILMWNVGVKKDWTTVTFEIPYHIILGESGAKINEMLSMVYGDDMLKSAIVYKQAKLPQEGCEDVGDDLQSDCPSYLCTEGNVDRVHALVLTNWRIMTRQLQWWEKYRYLSIRESRDKYRYFFWYRYLLINTLVFRFTWKIVSFLWNRKIFL